MSGLDSIPVIFGGQSDGDLRTQNLRPLLLQIEETALPGVWLTEHKDAEGDRPTLHLEVTRIPAILMAPEEDVAAALELLQGASKKV